MKEFPKEQLSKLNDFSSRLNEEIHRIAEEIKRDSEGLDLERGFDPNNTKDIICIHCKTRFSTESPFPSITPCKCGKIYCDVTPDGIRILGELDDFESIERES